MRMLPFAYWKTTIFAKLCAKWGQPGAGVPRGKVQMAEWAPGDGLEGLAARVGDRRQSGEDEVLEKIQLLCGVIDV